MKKARAKQVALKKKNDEVKQQRVKNMNAKKQEKRDQTDKDNDKDDAKDDDKDEDKDEDSMT